MNAVMLRRKEVIIFQLIEGEWRIYQETRPSLVQITACRLFGAKSSHNSMMASYQLGPCEQTSVKFESKFNNFQESEFENVCKMAIILSRPTLMEVLPYGTIHSFISIHRWDYVHMDHSGYELSQWESTLHCNVVFHWPRPYPEWFLHTGQVQGY